MEPSELQRGDYFETMHTSLHGSEVELFFVLKNDVEDKAVIVTYLDHETIRQATVMTYDCLNDMVWFPVAEERKQCFVEKSQWLDLAPFTYF